MTVRMRHTHGHTRNRRSHHALTMPRLSKCVKCGALHLRHRMCVVCGTYKGREVIDVMSKIIKKEEKKKEKREAKKGVPERESKKEKDAKTAKSASAKSSGETKAEKKDKKK